MNWDRSREDLERAKRSLSGGASSPFRVKAPVPLYFRNGCGAEAWSVAGHTLPQCGFYLRAGEVEAAVELREGKRVEWSHSPGQRYDDGKRTLASDRVLELPAEGQR